MKSNNPKALAVEARAKIALEVFLQFNPARRESSFVRVRHAGRGLYKAAYGYTSNQGTSTVGVIRSDEVDHAVQ